MVNIDKILFCLKSQYSTHNGEQRTFIEDILSEENIPYFEALTDYLKTF